MLISKSIFLQKSYDAGQVKVWDKNTGACLSTLEGKYTSFFVDGDWWILQKEKKVEVWNKHDLFMCKHVLEGKIKGIGTHIILFNKKVIYLLDKKTFQVTNKVYVDCEFVNQVIADGYNLVVAGIKPISSMKGVFVIGTWSLPTGKCLDCIEFDLVAQDEKMGAKIYFCGDYLVLLIEGRFVVVNKRNLKQQRCFGEEITDFWVNEERNEIVAKKGKLYHWGFHSAPTLTPSIQLINELEDIVLALPLSN